ncbi:MAG: hypothetical protein H0W46_05590 [Acidimicrobiia bacterium]|nr:hypothetical protein [Acidimicrobiia bacterium]
MVDEEMESDDCFGTDPSDEDDDHDDQRARRSSDLDLRELDDRRDREELRKRYYGLLQELRVVLPGVQVLLAFLLTVPFAQRFEDLDDLGRGAFAVATLSSMLSVVCLLTPAVYHRLAARTERTARLRWGIRMTVVGLMLLGIALVSGLWCVTRFVFGVTLAWCFTAPVAAAIVALWIVLPRLTGTEPDHHHFPTPPAR